MAVDGFSEADAPERRGAPFGAGGLELGAAVGEAGAHVVEEQVGVGEDELVGDGGDGMLAGAVARGMALMAAGGEEQLGAALAVGIAAGGGDGQGVDVEDDVVEEIGGDFGGAAVGRGEAIGLGRSAGRSRLERVGDADVAVEGGGDLRVDRGLVGLPAEAACFAAGQNVDAAGDAVAVGVLRVGELLQALERDRLEQAVAEDGRGQARADLQFGMQRAVGGFDDGEDGLDQLVGRAVGVFAADGFPLDVDFGFGRDAEDGAVLDAAAVDGIRDRRVAEVGGQADLDDEAADGVVVVEGRARAAVVTVAGGAGLGDEEVTVTSEFELANSVH